MLSEIVKNKVQGQSKYINLGYTNGWKAKDNEDYKVLSDAMVKGSFSVNNLGRCHNEYNFRVEVDGITYNVSYAVDSM